jgi:HK97 family phage portal protein
MANLIQRLAAALRPDPPAQASTAPAAAALAVKSAVWPGGSWSQLWMSGNDAGSGRQLVYADTPLGYINAVKYNPWASNCVTARAMSIASVPIKLYRRMPDHEPEEVTDHPVLDLLIEVNPLNLDATSYKEQIQRQKALHGTAYTLKVRDSSDAVRELYVLPAHLVEMVPGGEWVLGYRYGGQMYPPEDIIRDYYMDDADPRLARSPTATALAAINRYNLADLSQESIDKRGGQGGGIVGVDFNVIEGDAKAFMAGWRAHRSDPRNAGDDAFLPPGFTYEAGVLTAQQMQREERSQRLIKEIMGAYSIPPSLAGDYSDASVLANAAQQSKNFWDTWGTPEVRRMAEVLTYDLLWGGWPETREAGLFLAPDLSVVPALQEDLEKLAVRKRTEVEAAGAALQAGIISVNEAREMIGQEPINDPLADDALLITQASRPTFERPTPEPEPEPVEQGEEDEPDPQDEGQHEELQQATRAVQTMPIVDFVGMRAVTPAGEGTIEAIRRFGEHGGLLATKAEPVVIVDGAAFRAADVRVIYAGD